MDCQRIAELLPWHVNGTLAADEQEAVRAHLAECPACTRELEETAWVWSLSEPHVPAGALVNYAFSRPVDADERRRIERHAETCSACAEQLALVRESRRRTGEDAMDVPPLTPRGAWWPVGRWLYAALAASVVVGLAVLIGWLWNGQQVRSLQARLAEQPALTRQRLAHLETENQQLRQAEAQLQEQSSQARREIARLSERVQALSSPQLNVPVLDVYPRVLARQAGASEVNELAIPRGAQKLILILNSQSSATYQKYSLEILDAHDAVVWRGEGLRRHSTGDYTVSLPIERLPPGLFTLHVYGEENSRRVRVDSYRIRLLTRP